MARAESKLGLLSSISQLGKQNLRHQLLKTIWMILPTLMKRPLKQMQIHNVFYYPYLDHISGKTPTGVL